METSGPPMVWTREQLVDKEGGAIYNFNTHAIAIIMKCIIPTSDNCNIYCVTPEWKTATDYDGPSQNRYITTQCGSYIVN